jgi:FkbM family methyltransferase
MKAIIKKLLNAVGYQIQRRHASQIGLITVHAVQHCGRSLKFAVDIPSDGVQKSHVAGHVYEAEELAEIIEAFRPGVFVDVGANVGNHSVVLASAPGCKGVVAVEPNPRALVLLTLNIALNEIQDRVTILPTAFSDREIQYELHTPINNLGGTTIRPLARGGQPAEVSGWCDAVAGSTALRGNDVSFIKIDVEGHEIEVLRGLREIIELKRPDIFIEVGLSDRGEVEAFFVGCAYTLKSESSRYRDVFNLLFIPAEMDVSR